MVTPTPEPPPIPADVPVPQPEPEVPAPPSVPPNPPAPQVPADPPLAPIVPVPDTPSAPADASPPAPPVVDPPVSPLPPAWTPQEPVPGSDTEGPATPGEGGGLPPSGEVLPLPPVLSGTHPDSTGVEGGSSTSPGETPGLPEVNSPPTGQEGSIPTPGGEANSPSGPAASVLGGEEGGPNPGVIPSNPNEGVPATEQPEVKVVEALQPEGSLPVTEEMRTLPPIEATVQDLSTLSKESDRGPRPGGPVKLPEDNGNPPPTTNVHIEGDNNNVTIINVVDSPGAKVDVDVDQSRDEYFVVARRLDKPGHEFRFPAPPNRPIKLPSNFCGGEAGVWAFAGAGIGPNGPWANAGAGVFATSDSCGVVKRPPPPKPIVICPPAGWHGNWQQVNHYTIIDQRVNYMTVYANNTWISGPVHTQVINGVPQQVFIGEAPLSP